MEFFQASNHMVSTARRLKQNHGILPEVSALSKGKPLTPHIKQAVVHFFEDDNISRLCPGQRDCISVRDTDGSRQMKQKRLVLGNLKEIYQKFKEQDESPDIGFSTFCALRPKHCILAGSSGTHSVCVCTYHQNPKLQLNAIGEAHLKLENVMEMAVCDMNQEACMLSDCQDCPGKQGVINFVQTLDSMADREELRYKKWVTVDRCTLQDVVETSEEFLDSFSSAVVKLLRHHYISKKQSEAFKVAKESLVQSQGVLVGDFAENYSFLVQDAAQGFHWDNSQCTLHPFVFYFKGPDSSIQHTSFCFISDGTKHSTAMVYTFQKTLIPLLKSTHPQLLELIYFSDGCAGQYKNRFNFINLLNHEADFGVKAKWNFFATSHGKNACDGIGGTLKRSVARASLQRPSTDQILTAEEFYNYCHQKMSNIKCFFTRKEEVEAVAEGLEERFSQAMTIPGTQKHHHFSPVGNGFLEIAEISHSSSARKRVRIRQMSNESMVVEEPRLQAVVGSYVVVSDRSKKWVAYVDHQDEEFGDYSIRYLQPPGVRASYLFPENLNQSFKGKDCIIGVLPQPSLTGGSRIRYSFPREILLDLMNA